MINKEYYTIDWILDGRQPWLICQVVLMFAFPSHQALTAREPGPKSPQSTHNLLETIPRRIC